MFCVWYLIKESLETCNYSFYLLFKAIQIYEFPTFFKLGKIHLLHEFFLIFKSDEPPLAVRQMCEEPWCVINMPVPSDKWKRPNLKALLCRFTGRPRVPTRLSPNSPADFKRPRLRIPTPKSVGNLRTLIPDLIRQFLPGKDSLFACSAV